MLPDDLSWTVPHALDVEEIARMVDATARSCQHLQRYGFSGVELSCGHGHLFHQFLSPWRLRPSLNGIPLMATARITDPAETEAILQNGKAELIGLGRSLIADPAWLKKASEKSCPRHSLLPLVQYVLGHDYLVPQTDRLREQPARRKVG